MIKPPPPLRSPLNHSTEQNGGCSGGQSLEIVEQTEHKPVKIYSPPMKRGFYSWWHCSALQLLNGRKPLLRNSHITPNSFLDLDFWVPFRSHISELLPTQILLRLGIPHIAQSHHDSQPSAAPRECPCWQRLRFMLCYTSKHMTFL